MIRFTSVLLIALFTGFLQAEDNVPQGFEMQILEPTGGKILRPKGWFYTEGHRGASWRWTISKEDTHGGRDAYQTGVRIQAFPEVQQGTGKTAEVFVKEFIAGKQASANKVHKSCDPVDQGLFSRTCLEVTEGEYRILYSVFWGNDIDIAVISIAGAKTADWDANTKYFDAMSSFELIDMSRFPGKAKDKDEDKEGVQSGASKPAPAPVSGSEGR
jgi:hypothetical protein